MPVLGRLPVAITNPLSYPSQIFFKELDSLAVLTGVDFSDHPPAAMQLGFNRSISTAVAALRSPVCRRRPAGETRGILCSAGSTGGA